MSEPAQAEADQRYLLEVARKAVEARLSGWPFPETRKEGWLREPRGAFVTLWRRRDHELRGCVGYVEPVYSLVETVARAAVAAALDDGRFAPVTIDELPALAIEVSILSRLDPIRPEDVVVGKHGLLLRHKARSGLLLPQVPTEHGWDREAFLDHTCLKAGLRPGAWREPGAKLLGFTASIVKED
jgi:AmmeMemoRadiSam system protein A